MPRPNSSLDYDRVAGAYDQRYALHAYLGTRAALLGSLSRAGGRRVLEVGCGTGRWLAELAGAGAAEVAGLDPSGEMLQRASRAVSGDLRQGSAEQLPWNDKTFDLVFYVNALHHFSAPERAIAEAFRVLRPGGRLLSIGLDPHEGCDHWYVYDFFPEALALDLARFAPKAQRVAWMRGAGLRHVTVAVAERLRAAHRLEDARAAGILERSFTSQLTAISDDAYTAGIERLEAATARDPELRLQVDLSLDATEAAKPTAQTAAPR